MSKLRNKRFPELFRKAPDGPWWAYVPNPAGGRKLREPTKLHDERAAHEWYLQRVRSPVSAVRDSGKKERTLHDALVTRIEWLEAARESDDPSRKKLAKDTISFYEKKSRALTSVLGKETRLSAIDHEKIRRYIVTRSKTVKATTIGKELTALSMAMRLARKDGVACPVFKDIVPEDFQALYVPRTRWLTEAEVDALLDVLPPKRAAVVAFIVATSATYPSEVAPVRPAMVDRVTYVVHLPGTKRRTRNRILRVPSHARKYLDRALPFLGPSGFEKWSNVNGDLLTAAKKLSLCAKCRKAPPPRPEQAPGRQYAEAVPTARYANGRAQIVGSRRWCAANGAKWQPPVNDCKACKVTPAFPPLSPNDLRRTFVQWLVRSGVPNELVAPMTGHGDTRMIEQVYGKREATAVADLVEQALKKAPKGARRRTG